MAITHRRVARVSIQALTGDNDGAPGDGRHDGGGIEAGPGSERVGSSPGCNKRVACREAQDQIRELGAHAIH